MALHVDGNDGAFFVARDASLEPPDEITVEAWVKGEGSVSHGRIVRKGDPQGSMPAWSFQMSKVSGLVHCDSFKVAYDPARNSDHVGAWHHFAMTAIKNEASMKPNDPRSGGLSGGGREPRRPRDRVTGTARRLPGGRSRGRGSRRPSCPTGPPIAPGTRPRAPS